MSSLGDIIHTFPAVTDLRRALPGAALDWVVEENYLPLARMHPGVTRVLPIALRRWRRQVLSARSWREAAAFRARLREHSYDAILDTQGLLKSAAVACLARGPAYGFGRGTAHEPLAARFYDVGYEFTASDHKVERYRAVAARALGYAPGALDYGIAPPPVRGGKGALLFGSDTVACPQCRSTRTTRISEFGSTPCKALWRCKSCAEPFDAFKCL